jgi:hypothetical protein
MPAAILTRRARIGLREAVRRIGTENLAAACRLNVIRTIRGGSVVSV